MQSVHTMLARLHHLSAFDSPAYERDEMEREMEKLRSENQELLHSGIKKNDLMPVVQQLRDQIECGTQRLEGELKDWRAGPVQDNAGGWALRHVLDMILTILHENKSDDIKIGSLKKIREKLNIIRSNLYLQQTYSAVAKRMTRPEHEYIAREEEYAQAASWGPAIALFQSQHPGQEWLPLHTLFRTICDICIL